MARPKKEWIVFLNNNVVTEEMLHSAIFSVSKRAKNCRDKVREYKKISYTYAGIYHYEETKEKYYDMKKTMLSVLQPYEVHSEKYNTGWTQYYLLYKTAYGSYHDPVHYREVKKANLHRTGKGKGGKFKPRMKQVHLHTKGADINTLLSAQFSTKIYHLVQSGDFTYIPAYNHAA